MVINSKKVELRLKPVLFFCSGSPNFLINNWRLLRDNLVLLSCTDLIHYHHYQYQRWWIQSHEILLHRALNKLTYLLESPLAYATGAGGQSPPPKSTFPRQSLQKSVLFTHVSVSLPKSQKQKSCVSFSSTLILSELKSCAYVRMHLPLVH